MKSKGHITRLAATALVVVATAGSAAAQSTAPLPVNQTAESSRSGDARFDQAASAASSVQRPDLAKPPAEHPMWRDVLLGMGIGAGSGVILGAAWSYSQRAICTADLAVSCDSRLNMANLSGVGIAIGGVLGVVANIHRGHGPRASTVSLIPSLTPTRKTILMRAQF